MMAPDAGGATYTLGGQAARLPPAAAAAAAAAARYATSAAPASAAAPPDLQREAREEEEGAVDVTTAFERTDNAEAEREEEILAAWGAVGAYEGAQGSLEAEDR